MISSGEKKALAIIAAVIVAFVAVVGTSVFLLTRDATHDDQPYIHIAVGKELRTVEALWWCDLMLTECDPEITRPRATAEVPVEVGTTAMFTVSSEIADGPWNLAAVYLTPKGLIEDEQPQEAGKSYTLTLKSTPDRVLLGVTVLSASARLTPADEILPRGEFAIQTASQEYLDDLG
ncbi:DUF2771 family protein [Gordonia sp. zg691]|uniref:DUF2771 family protein n=1 Tax=Gordonia jinghuaiqii TaxID=2758710 RepID=UPI0016623966|nr:DUF2771 family protein [Gordonia jinghuaiqii]MBD0863913.1 DUF2771 family protein [Gordonia jinghuaiqii]